MIRMMGDRHTHTHLAEHLPFRHTRIYRLKRLPYPGLAAIAHDWAVLEPLCPPHACLMPTSSASCLLPACLVCLPHAQLICLMAASCPLICRIPAPCLPHACHMHASCLPHACLICSMIASCLPHFCLMPILCLPHARLICLMPLSDPSSHPSLDPVIPP